MIVNVVMKQHHLLIPCQVFLTLFKCGYNDSKTYYPQLCMLLAGYIIVSFYITCSLTITNTFISTVQFLSSNFVRIQNFILVFFVELEYEGNVIVCIKLDYCKILQAISTVIKQW